MDAFSNNF
jgi:hypothetical protein